MRDMLSRNQRIRCLVVDSDYIIDFESKIVNFIEDFVKKYNSKIKLHECPIFCIIGGTALINSIWKRLNEKNVIVERGHITGEFNVNHFLRKPLKEIKEGKLEFKVRICSYNDEFEHVEKQIQALQAQREEVLGTKASLEAEIAAHDERLQEEERFIRGFDSTIESLLKTMEMA